MALRGWIASHTGLPSLMATGGEPIYAGDRLLAVPGRARSPRMASIWGNPRALMIGPRLETVPTTTVVSDAMAVPGSTMTYRQGDSSVTLTRPTAEWWRAMISGMDGRTVPDLVWEGDGDKRDWSSGVSRFNGRVARWALDTPTRTGTATLALLDPDRHAEVWDLLQRREPLIVTPGAHADALPPRFVTIDKADSKRFGTQNFVRYTVSWTELPEDSPMLVGGTTGWGAAPVVTWAEWQAHGSGTWESGTYLDVCRRIAGMP